MSERKGDLMLLAAAFVGGFGIIGMKLLMSSGYGTYQLVTVRFFITTVLMLTVFSRHLKGLRLKEVGQSAFMSLFLFAMFVLMVVGLKYTTAAVSGFLINVHAAMVPFLVWIFSKKLPRAVDFFAGALTVAGMALMSLETGFSLNFGAVLTILGSLSYAIYVMYVERYSRQMDPIRLTLLQDFFVFAYGGIAVLLFEPQFPPFGKTECLAFLIIAFLSTFLFFLLQIVGQKYTTASKASVIVSAESVFTALFAFAFLREPLTLRVVLGGVLIFAAIFLCQGEKRVDKH